MHLCWGKKDASQKTNKLNNTSYVKLFLMFKKEMLCILLILGKRICRINIEACFVQTGARLILQYFLLIFFLFVKHNILCFLLNFWCSIYCIFSATKTYYQTLSFSAEQREYELCYEKSLFWNYKIYSSE